MSVNKNRPFIGSIIKNIGNNSDLSHAVEGYCRKKSSFDYEFNSTFDLRRKRK